MEEKELTQNDLADKLMVLCYNIIRFKEVVFMRKIITILLSLCFLLAGCGETNKEDMNFREEAAVIGELKGMPSDINQLVVIKTYDKYNTNTTDMTYTITDGKNKNYLEFVSDYSLQENLYYSSTNKALIHLIGGDDFNYYYFYDLTNEYSVRCLGYFDDISSKNKIRYYFDYDKDNMFKDFNGYDLDYIKEHNDKSVEFTDYNKDNSQLENADKYLFNKLGTLQVVEFGPLEKEIIE